MLFTLSHVVSSSRLLVNFLTSLSSSASSLRSQTPNCSVQSESCGTQVFHHRNPHNVWTTTVTNLIFSFSIRPLVRSVFGRVDGFYVLSLRPPHRELQYSTPYAHSAPQYIPGTPPRYKIAATTTTNTLGGNLWNRKAKTKLNKRLIAFGEEILQSVGVMDKAMRIKP